jgi:PKD repeat protein
MARALRFALLLVAAAAFTGCTLSETSTPPLSGPSELGLSLTLAATPDILTQDGSSQATVTVFARDGGGQPRGNVSCRVEIRVDGRPADYGMLSARNVTTGSDGRAVLYYTAPPSTPVSAADTVIDLAVTPIGNNFGNSFERFVSIRLVPSGTITPPGGVPAYFAFTPTAPAEMEAVTFGVTFCTTATTTGCTPNSGATGFSWSFGDGGTGTGATAIHQYNTAGTYMVTLTVTDSRGWPSSASQSVTVKAGQAPTASFTLTPASPRVLQDAILDGSASTAAAGRRIVQYEWNFGDGTPVKVRTESFTNHDWGTAGNFPVTLKVTDDAGRTATKMVVVIVIP